MNSRKNALASCSMGLASVAGVGFILHADNLDMSLWYYVATISISAIVLAVSYFNNGSPSKEESKEAMILCASITLVIFVIAASLSWNPLELIMIVGSAAMCIAFHIISRLGKPKKTTA